MSNIFPEGVERLVAKLQYELLPNREPTKQWFDWQTLPLGTFYAGMHAVRQKLGPGRFSFVDVGSGIGTKLFLADTLGFEVWGIERRPDYVEVSNALFPEYPVKCIDALEYQDYADFDVIYSYRLARKDQLQERVNAHIVEHMRDGAIFFSTDTPASAKGLMQLDGVEELIP
jgi:SAM-dependent methyltransferase